MVDTTQEPWTVGRCFEWTIGYFERLGVPQPRVSAEWLVTSATGLGRIGQAVVLTPGGRLIQLFPAAGHRVAMVFRHV